MLGKLGGDTGSFDIYIFFLDVFANTDIPEMKKGINMSPLCVYLLINIHFWGGYLNGFFPGQSVNFFKMSKRTQPRHIQSSPCEANKDNNQR